MPMACCMRECTNNAKKDKKMGVKRSYFSIPTVKEREGPIVREVTEARRREWCKQIYRKDITFQQTTVRNHTVCSDHFVNGKPAYEMSRTDPDWAPTLKLGHDFGQKPTLRGSRLQARQERKGTTAAQVDVSSESDFEIETDGTCIDDTNHCLFQISGTLEKHQSQTCSISTQTDLSADMISGIETEMNRLLLENIDLKKAAEKKRFDEKYFDGSDEKAKFFTGLPNLTTLMLLFEFLLPHIPKGPRYILSPFEMLVMTFMRLRFNLPMQLLAYIFNLSRSTAGKYFHSMIDIMYVRLHPLIIWPERDILRATQPTDFKRAFGGRIAVIIDCFEIFIETPSDLVAKAQTFSSYKHHNTVKYLIGITPAGAISYISRGWGGRTSDKHVTEYSNFVNNLNPGDIVLADRGFDISDIVGFVQAEVKIPAFTKGKPQLSAHEVESTRKIAHLRIHVERVIGTMCGKYNILNGSIPVDNLATRGGENMCALDKIVTVCCSLVNLCESVVPLK